LAGLYTEKAEEYCRQQGTNISDCFGAVAFVEVWRLINTLSGRKSRPARTVARTAAEQNSSLRGHFEGLLGGISDAPVLHMETVLPPQNIADGEFTIAEVAAASVPFKNGKAAGLDRIQVKLIKLPGIAEKLTPMLNTIYVSGNAPEAFRRAAIVPIPKKGDLSQNWRGIIIIIIIKIIQSCAVKSAATRVSPIASQEWERVSTWSWLSGAHSLP